MTSYQTEQRWSGLFFAVHRNSQGTADWTLVHRTVKGDRRWDRKLAWGRIDTPPGSPASRDALTALRLALEAASRAGSEQADGSVTSPAEPSAPPGGSRGEATPDA